MHGSCGLMHDGYALAAWMGLVAVFCSIRIYMPLVSSSEVKKLTPCYNSTAYFVKAKLTIGAYDLIVFSLT
jgi:hypothetical protein